MDICQEALLQTLDGPKNRLLDGNRHSVYREGTMPTILLAILAFVNVFALWYALIASKRVAEPKEAKQTAKRHEPEYVTREQLTLALEETTKDLNYEWNEWYEKFDKLHLRLAKRADREKKREQSQTDNFDEHEAPPSALNFRRLGSV